MFGVDWHNPETLWLNLTNAVLGLATLVALLAVFSAGAVELYRKLKKRASEVPDLHVLHLPDLGLTMADGGEAKAPNPDDDKPPFWD